MNTREHDTAFPTTFVQNRASQGRGFTAIEYAALTLRVPNSGTPWLDEMIAQSLSNEFAGKTSAGIADSEYEYDTTQTNEKRGSWGFE